MKKSFKNDWKLYGLTLNNITLIPCYYDWQRYIKKLFNKRISFVEWENVKRGYKSLWDINIDF